MPTATDNIKEVVFFIQQLIMGTGFLIRNRSIHASKNEYTILFEIMQPIAIFFQKIPWLLCNTECILYAGSKGGYDI